MRGINQVTFCGNIGGPGTYSATGSGTPACSFKVASDRKAGETTITTWAKINCYGEGLVEICRQRAKKGGYVIVSGELMNREGAAGDQTEIRAREVVFVGEATP
jgi:single-stranded DNA-binding protein